MFSNSKAPHEPSPAETSLLRASGITGFMTLVSRVLGLTRDVVIARFFGASDGADVFFLANKIPNFMRRLFAEGAFNQAFVPILSEYRSQRDFTAVKNLIAATAASLGGTLLLLSTIVIVGAPFFAIVIANGYVDEPAKFDLFVSMLRITFPYLFLVSMTSLCGAVLNSYGKFAVPAITPALLNLSLIGAAIILSPLLSTPELALAWGVLVAGVAQLFFQLPFLARIRLLALPKREPTNTGLIRIKKLIIPALFGVSVSQINLLFDTLIASFLASGSVSWLYFSDRLMELPLGIFGVALGIAVLPSLSRRHAENSVVEFAKTLDWALRLVLLVAIPAALALYLISEPLLVTLFENGRFSQSDVENSASSLRAYAIGLIAFMAIKVLAPGYYARQDTITPVQIGVGAMILNMILNGVFFYFGMAHVGLALATSFAAIFNAVCLLLVLLKKSVFCWQPGWPTFILRLVLANIVMSLFLLFYVGTLEEWLQKTMSAQIIDLSFLVVGGIVSYICCLSMFGFKWREIYR
ncbi:murein biosynthesis integral membrane protein MurJ [Gammaproteobacteria bacterium]|nr:murein biosynthesis integral membrane protein MurJ [Gammaproteobacteria bacterium]